MDPSIEIDATGALGGFVLVVFIFSLLLAWPKRQRWPWWLIGGLSLSVSSALALVSLGFRRGWINGLAAGGIALTALLTSVATVRDLRDPRR